MTNLNDRTGFFPRKLYRLAGEKLLAFAGKEKNLEWVAKLVLVSTCVPFALAMLVVFYNVLRWAHYVP
jgi:hypothetical protein